jgi:hypothetical protein
MAKTKKPSYKIGTLVQLSGGEFVMIEQITFTMTGFAYVGSDLTETQETFPFEENAIKCAFKKIEPRKPRKSATAKKTSRKTTAAPRKPSPAQAKVKAKKAAAVAKVKAKKAKEIEPMFPGQYENPEENQLPM